MKKNIIYILIALTVVGFTACESDDTDFSDIINNNSSGGSQGGEGGGEEGGGEEGGGTGGNTSDLTITQSSSLSKAVEINWTSVAAELTVASDIYSSLTFEGTGTQVIITSSASLTDEVTYTLSGTASKGSFFLNGSTDATVAFNGLTLTCADSAAVNIQNGKRINVVVEGTNTLKDGTKNTGKGALVINGHSQFSGSGTLTLYGMASNAFWADEYIQFKQSFTGSLVVTYAASDGINVNQYFEQNGGTLKISGIMGDGLQVNADDKYTGYVNINGGTIDISAAGAACKGIKAAGYIRIDDDKSAPVITVANSGTGTYDDINKKAVGAACMASDADITIDAGTITFSATGNGGKGLKCDSTFTMNGGTLTISTTGVGYTSNGDSTYPKGVKAGTDSGTLAGGIVINGGNVSVTVSGRASGCEGMESDNIITIKGGVTTVNAYDDAINSGSDMTVEGGCVYARSTNNDGIDTNGNCYIKGGLVYAIGGNAPEVAIDANSEAQKKLYLTGGTIIALGGLESGASLSQTCYAASSWSKNTWYALTYGNETFAFQTPSSGGTTMVVSAASTPSLLSGVSVSGGTEIFDGVAYTGASVSGGTSVTLSNYTGGNQGGGPGGDGPGGGGHPGGR